MLIVYLQRSIRVYNIIIYLCTLSQIFFFLNKKNGKLISNFIFFFLTWILWIVHDSTNNPEFLGLAVIHNHNKTHKTKMYLGALGSSVGRASDSRSRGPRLWHESWCWGRIPPKPAPSDGRCVGGDQITRRVVTLNFPTTRKHRMQNNLEWLLSL